ncbi:MAG: type II toxin-antitoxin system VapC family toxin [Akkermansiaceae bacterium]|nr:type II toxin-antitoxin system VapC family toxin [Akkermansiaceae bacterium]
MKRILDTNVCIDVLRGRKKVVQRLAACRPEDCYISVITEFELFQGADRAPEDRREEENSKVSRFISSLQILPFDSSCAQAAAHINAKLLNQGTPISITDVFIAATAAIHQHPLVTNNTKDFRRIEALTLEDW